MPVEHTPSRNEDEYFARENAELLRQHRAALDLERQRAAAEQPMRCPRCGGSLQEREFQSVKIDVCTACGGTWLDRGELELLSRTDQTSRRGFLGALFGSEG
jgi:hypothetical protein